MAEQHPGNAGFTALLKNVGFGKRAGFLFWTLTNAEDADFFFLNEPGSASRFTNANLL
jgi:hypothetical protein